MKKIALVAAIAAALVSSFSVQAADVNGGFNVQINLTSVCQIMTPSIGQLTMNYTSFGAAASGNTTFGVRCTTGLPYTVSLDAASTVDNNGFGTQTAGTNTGLAYSLGVDGGGRTGTGLTVITHTITGNIAAGLPGSCATATCTDNIGKTVFINY